MAKILVLTVVKKAEDDDGLIFRFYEFQGKPAEVRLQLPRRAASARGWRSRRRDAKW
jgi:alpha-mannosidase